MAAGGWRGEGQMGEIEREGQHQFCWGLGEARDGGRWVERGGTQKGEIEREASTSSGGEGTGWGQSMEQKTRSRHLQEC